MLLAAATPAAPATLAQLRVDLDGATLQVAVRDLADPASGRGDRQLAIDCIAACRHALHYREAIDDLPLGVWRFGDGGNLVFTSWVGGSAYRVRVYAVRARGVEKVLDTSSLGAPEVGMSRGGEILVATTARGDREPPASAPHRVTWLWRGKRFVHLPTPR